MNHHLTSVESRLAVWLPCTTAAVAAWYSRIWRTPEQRMQTLVWAALIALAIAVLVWLAPPSNSPSTRRAVPDNARGWLGALVVLAGIRAGLRPQASLGVA